MAGFQDQDLFLILEEIVPMIERALSVNDFLYGIEDTISLREIAGNPERARSYPLE